MSERSVRDRDMRLSNDRPEDTPSRRQFLGLLGATAVTSVGFSGTAVGQETPGIVMSNNYFDPVGLYIGPAHLRSERRD